MRYVGAKLAIVGVISSAALIASAPSAAMPPTSATSHFRAYLPQSAEEETALARSAAPAAISSHAEIMVFSPQGYKLASKGTNGFTCLVERSWAKDPGDKEFWNPKMRAPTCFNPAAVKSVLSAYLERTKWVLAGAGEAEVKSRIEQSVRSRRIAPPQAGAMSYMMSKDQYLSNAENGHPWHPHVMFYYPVSVAKQTWGADLEGSPVLSDTAKFDRVITFMVPVGHWSDGSPAAPAEQHH